MTGRFLILLFTGLVLATAGARPVFPFRVLTQQDAEDATPEAGGEHLRVETEHGPLHLWRPENYDARTAGVVVYIHGYFTSADQT